MEIKAIQDEIINAKILYLNGYLDALALMNSYQGGDMSYRLFKSDFSGLSVEEAIIQHSYELWGGIDGFKFELKKIENWKFLVSEELEIALKRRVPYNERETLEYAENSFVRGLKSNYTMSFQRFIRMLDDELLSELRDVYLLNIETDKMMYSVGFELIFEVPPAKIIILQLRACF